MKKVIKYKLECFMLLLMTLINLSNFGVIHHLTGFCYSQEFLKVLRSLGPLLCLCLPQANAGVYNVAAGNVTDVTTAQIGDVTQCADVSGCDYPGLACNSSLVTRPRTLSLRLKNGNPFSESMKASRENFII